MNTLESGGSLGKAVEVERKTGNKGHRDREEREEMKMGAGGVHRFRIDEVEGAVFVARCNGLAVWRPCQGSDRR